MAQDSIARGLAAAALAATGTVPAHTHVLNDITDMSANARTLNTQTFANMRTSLSLVPGTNVQAYNTNLQGLSGLTGVANRVPYFTGAGTFALAVLGNSANGIPLLDSNGKLLSSILPNIAITDRFVVASQTAMLALTAERGDIAIRTDLNRTFILGVDDPTVLANWSELLTPTDAVLSVAGLTGTITAAQLRTALSLATVATTGAYGDLSGRPTLATVATSGSYADLLNRPSFATVATSGSYADLLNKPSLGSAAALNVGTAANNVVQLDVNGKLPAIDGSQLTNLPGGGAGGGTGNVTGPATTTVGNFVLWGNTNGTSVTNGGVPGALAYKATINNADWNGTALAVANGGSGATTAAQARTNLGVAIGTDVQAQNVNLQSFAGLGGVAGTVPFFSGTNVLNAFATVSFSRNLLSLANASDWRSNLGLGSAAVLNTNVANGVPTLDSNSKLQSSQLPDSVLGGVNYRGGYNASTNSPAIGSATSATKGYYYVVNTAGTQTLTNGDNSTKSISFEVGDWVISSGATWDKVDSSDQVNSVAGLQGSITATDLKTALAIAFGDISGTLPNSKLATMPVFSIKANNTSSVTTPGDFTLTQLLDAYGTQVQGTLYYRNASSLTTLAPGTAGQVLTTGGTGADPSWAPPVPADKAITNAKLANAIPFTIKCNVSSVAASPVDANVTSLFDNLLGNSPGALIWRSTVSGNWTALSPGSQGQVLTMGASSAVSWTTPVAATPADGSITNAKLANMAVLTIKANIGGADAAPQDVGMSDLLAATLTNGSTGGGVLARNTAGWRSTGAGTAGQVLTSAGSSTPVWSSAPFPIATTSDFTSSGSLAVAAKGWFFNIVGAITVGLPAPATAGAGWFIHVTKRDGSAPATITTPSGTIDGQTFSSGMKLYQETYTIWCDGTNYFTLGRQRGWIAAQRQSAVALTTASGFSFFDGFNDPEISTVEYDITSLVSTTGSAASFALQMSKAGAFITSSTYAFDFTSTAGTVSTAASSTATTNAPQNLLSANTLGTLQGVISSRSTLSTSALIQRIEIDMKVPGLTRWGSVIQSSGGTFDGFRIMPSQASSLTYQSRVFRD